MGKKYTIAEFLGDGISAELCQSVHRIADSFPFDLHFQQVDLSLENRKKKGDAVYNDALDAIQKHGFAMKYPTTTPTDGESPNKILRERCRFSVIHRPTLTIPSIPTNFKKKLDIDVVRVATGGTYDDAGRRIGTSTAVSIRVIERIPCEEAARFAFEIAKKRGTSVTSASKFTIQRETDGLFEEAVRKISRSYPDIVHRSELFDAMLANLIMNPQHYGVIVTPNEYGDFLSDCACGLVGSIGLGDSSSYSFSPNGKIKLAMFDPAGGTAPAIAGKNLANPTAALLALCSLLAAIGEDRCSRALKNAILSAIADGKTTSDIGGSLGTREFTEEVAARVIQEISPSEKPEENVPS